MRKSADAEAPVLRDEGGRFLPGTRGGPGNPNARNVAAWREALAGAVTAEDLGRVVEVLKSAAFSGEAWAVRELLDRCLGKPHVAVSLTQRETPLKTYVNIDVERVSGRKVDSPT